MKFDFILNVFIEYKFIFESSSSITPLEGSGNAIECVVLFNCFLVSNTSLKDKLERTETESLRDERSKRNCSFFDVELDWDKFFVDVFKLKWSDDAWSEYDEMFIVDLNNWSSFWRNELL